MAFENLALLLPGQSMEDFSQMTTKLARKAPLAVAWARTSHGICSPIGNGIGSHKRLTSSPPLRLISSSHLRGGCYSVDRSNLFESHWSNQWLTSVTVKEILIPLAPTLYPLPFILCHT